MNEAQRDVALFRYSLIREAADESLTVRQRGRARARAGRARPRRAERPARPRGTRDDRPLDPGLSLRRLRGAGARTSRTGEPVTEQAAVGPGRGAQARGPAAHRAPRWPRSSAPPRATGPRSAPCSGTSPAWGSTPAPTGRRREAFGRFEAAAPGDLWTGDALHGPVIAGRKTYLFAFIDDHSRALVGYRWGHSEDTVRLEAAFRAALAARGVPRRLLRRQRLRYVSKQLLRACASLGVRLVHSRARTTRKAAGRSNGSSRRCASSSSSRSRPGRRADLAELNRLFSAWVETVYHRRVHTETGEAPIDRLLAAGAADAADPAALHEAFLWSETRTVTKTATVSLHGNAFEVDAALVGSRVEVVFDPFDLELRRDPLPGPLHGERASRSRIGRHAHPMARPEAAPAPGADRHRLPGPARRAPRGRARRLHQLRPARSRGDAGAANRPTRPTPRRQGDPAMTIDRLRAHWGFTRMPFSKDLAPSMLHTHRSHAEAVGPHHLVRRGAGHRARHRRGRRRQVRRRACRAGRPRRQPHTPSSTSATRRSGRGACTRRSCPPSAGTPRFHRASLIPQAAEALATEEDERGRRVVLVLDEAHLLDAEQLEGLRMLDQRRHGQPLALRLPARRPADAAPTHPPRGLRRPRPAGGAALLDDRHGRRRDVELRRPTT